MDADAIRLVVFDLAGTTVRDSGQVPKAFTTALAADGITVTKTQVEAVRGSSKREAIRNFVPAGVDHEERAQRVYAAFRSGLSDLYREGGVEPIAGADDVFGWLRGRGVRVALNTGFDRDITGLLLGALGWPRGSVDAVVCGDDVANGRPAPDLILRAMSLTGTLDARSVVNVGDTVLDLQAGAQAGVAGNVGVLTGAHSRERLAQAPHTHLLPSVRDLRLLWSA